jgi:hypothetical protein
LNSHELASLLFEAHTNTGYGPLFQAEGVIIGQAISPTSTS